MITADELRAARYPLSWQNAVIAIVLFFAGVSLEMVAVSLIEQHISGMTQWLTIHFGGWSIILAFVLAALPGAMVMYCGITYLTAEANKKELRCPDCHQACDANLVLAAGRCNSCGHVVAGMEQIARRNDRSSNSGLLSISDLIEAKTRRPSAKLFTCMFVGLIVSGVFGAAAPRRLREAIGVFEFIAWMIVSIVPWFLFFTIGGFQIIRDWWRGRDPKTLCLHCRKSLANKASFAIATGYCPFCGFQVVEHLPVQGADAPIEESSELCPFESFTKAISSRRWQAAWAAARLIVGLIVLMLAIDYIWPVAVHDKPTPREGMPLAIFLMGLVVIMADFARIGRKADRDPLLRCPHCQNKLCEKPEFVIATRTCLKCLRRILAEPQPALRPQ